ARSRATPSPPEPRFSYDFRDVPVRYRWAMPYGSGHGSRPRRRWPWGAATAGLLATVSLGSWLIQAHAEHPRCGAPAWNPSRATDDTAIPDDTVLLQELEKAIDLRRREDFD